MQGWMKSGPQGQDEQAVTYLSCWEGSILFPIDKLSPATTGLLSLTKVCFMCDVSEHHKTASPPKRHPPTQTARTIPGLSTMMGSHRHAMVPFGYVLSMLVVLLIAAPCNADYTLGVRDSLMIAHSFHNHPSFGPAGGMVSLVRVCSFVRSFVHSFQEESVGKKGFAVPFGTHGVLKVRNTWLLTINHNL